MKRKEHRIIALAIAAVLCMGGTCRQEVGQSAADSFWSTLAEVVAQTLADTLLDGGM